MMKKTLLLGLTLGVLSLGGVASADRPHRRAVDGRVTSPVITKADRKTDVTALKAQKKKNQNKKKAKPAVRPKDVLEKSRLFNRFTTIDTDGDKRISAFEMALFEMNEIPRRFNRLDTNKDGQLSRAELNYHNM